MLGELSYREHLLRVAPLAMLCLGINHALVWAVFRKQLGGGRLSLEAQPPCPPFNVRTSATLAVIVATAIAYTFGADLAWAATTGFVALMLLHRRDTRLLWERIDWSLLLFFASLFILVEGLMRSGTPDALFARFPLSQVGNDGSLAGWWQLSGLFLVGSNIVSNVPFILVVREQMATLTNPTLGWELLAIASTFAGNLTLLGSVANIIVAESARDIGGIGFVDYLKVGLPLALITTSLGVGWLLLFFPL